VAVSQSPAAAHGNSDGQAHLFRARGNGFTTIDTWGETPALRRMPDTLTTLPDQPGHLLVALRGGTLLLTRDAGDSWSQLPAKLPDAIDLAISSQ